MRKVTIACLTVLVLNVTVASVAANDVVGQWSSLQDLPAWMPHTHLLPTGKVMMWPGFGRGEPPGCGIPTPRVSPTRRVRDLTCSAAATCFSPMAGCWSRAAISRLASGCRLLVPTTRSPTRGRPAGHERGRWYPTATCARNGDVLVVSARIDPTIGVNRLPQVYQAASGTWRNLTNAQLGMDLYPRMLLAPNGKVFNPGAEPDDAVSGHLGNRSVDGGRRIGVPGIATTARR